MPDLATDRLDDLAERLEEASRRLNGSGASVAQEREQGERLRRRHGELRARSQSGGDAMEHDIKALEDAVERWAVNVDQRFADGAGRP
jgi:hypothetical protein